MDTSTIKLSGLNRTRQQWVRVIPLLAGLAIGLAPAMQAVAQTDDGIAVPPELGSSAAQVSLDESGFPELPAITGIPGEVDGPRYLIDEVSLQYLVPHDGMPSAESLMQLPIELLQTPEGLVAPRVGLPTVRLTLTQLSDGQTRVVYGSGIIAIGRSLIEELKRHGIVGVQTQVDPAEPLVEADAGGQATPTALRLQLIYVVAHEVKTIASGDRINPERRIDNPLHARIRRNSPVAPLGSGQTDLIREDKLDDYALLLSRYPGRRVDVAIAKASGTGPLEQNRAEVQYLVQESKPWTLYAQLSNTGTKSTDEWRERFGAMLNQLRNRDDTLSLEYVTAGFESSHAVIGSYESRLGDLDRLRWRVAGTYNQYDASEVGLLGETFTGSGWTASGDLIWNFYQRGNTFVDLVAGARYEHIEVENTSFLSSNRGEDDLFLPHIGVQAERNSETSNIFGSLNLEWTVSSISGANRDSLELLGRLNPDQDWYTLQWDVQTSFFLEPLLNYDAWADPTTPRSSTLAHELVLSFRGQYAFEHRLIPNAEQVLGGLYTVRGYEESSVAGDTTWVGSIEYRFHLPRALSVEPEPHGRLFGREFKSRPQTVYGRPDWDLMLKGFVDFGQAYNSDRLAFENDESLVGAGLGLELSLFNNLSFRTDWGVVLDEVGDGQQEVGDNRLHVVLTILF